MHGEENRDEEEKETAKKVKKKEKRIRQDKREKERRKKGKAKAGRLKQGAAGDAPGGGRRRVRRFAPRLPVTCLSLNPSPPPNHLFVEFSFVSTLQRTYNSAL